MSSTTEICNLALGWLGIPPVATLTERKPEATYSALYYPQALDRLLRAHSWNFARRRVVLAGIAVPDGYAATWAYAYAMPADCIQARSVLDSLGTDINYEVALDATASTKVILTSVSPAYLAYTARIEDPTLFDPTFAHALARRLSADLVNPLLKNNINKVQEAERLYGIALVDAQNADAGEGLPEPEADSDWILARTRGW